MKNGINKASFNIAIIGGGLAGLTLSIGLTHVGIPHKVYESAKCFSEIGAGICMGPNAVTALRLVDSRLKECYDRCATYNESPDQRDTFLNYRYGMKSKENGPKFGDIITSIKAYSKTETGRSCVHRARFLDELIQLIPDDVPEFNKNMTNMQETADGVRIDFDDGTTAYASAVIACDGVKSLARKIVLGAGSQGVEPIFTGEFAYRTMIPRLEADAILGRELSGNGNLYCGQGGYVITYPVDHGKLVNMVAIRLKEDLVWDDERWLVPMSRETMIDDFNGWGDTISQLLAKVKDTSRWALYDVPNATTFCKGRICLIGDAAHASTPNQGAGASMAYEDAYILSTLLGDIESSDEINGVFEAFDAVRRPRTQDLVATSRTAVDVYGFGQKDVGDDLAKIKENLDARHTWIWDVDLPGEVEKARMLLKKK